MIHTSARFVLSLVLFLLFNYSVVATLKNFIIFNIHSGIIKVTCFCSFEWFSIIGCSKSKYSSTSSPLSNFLSISFPLISLLFVMFFIILFLLFARSSYRNNANSIISFCYYCSPMFAVYLSKN